MRVTKSFRVYVTHIAIAFLHLATREIIIVSHWARLPNKEIENKQRHIGVKNCLYGELDSTHIYGEHIIEINERNNGLYGELTGIQDNIQLSTKIT